MPFENITIDGETKDFQQVLLGLKSFFTVPHMWLDLLPPSGGWSFNQYVSALEQMIGDAADKLYKSNEDNSNDIKVLQDKLADLSDLELIVSRLQEQLNALSVK
jgi:hypothetical protein